MMIFDLKDSMFKEECFAAATKSVIPATNFTPAYYTICVYLQSIAQPIVHTYETEEERDRCYDVLASRYSKCNQE